MAEKRKHDLEREAQAGEPASRPLEDLRPETSADPRRGTSQEPAATPSRPASHEGLESQTPEELAAQASEELLTPRGLPSATTPPADAIVLTGFLGASGRAGYRRLYLDGTLKEYVDVPDDDVRHLEWVGTEQSVFGRKATLWISREALLEYTTNRN